MLTKKFQDALNKQVANEAFASSSYLAMASWCHDQGLHGCTTFFYKQSAEEREHMMKLIKYVSDAGGHAHIAAIEEPKCQFESIGAVFEAALRQEEGVTKQIYKLVEMSFDEKDFASFNFLQWYVEEQLEEESLFNKTLDIMKLAGKETRSLLLIDKEISHLKDEEEAEKAGT